MFSYMQTHFQNRARRRGRISETFKTIRVQNLERPLNCSHSQDNLLLLRLEQDYVLPPSQNQHTVPWAGHCHCEIVNFGNLPPRLPALPRPGPRCEHTDQCDDLDAHIRIAVIHEVVTRPSNSPKSSKFDHVHHSCCCWNARPRVCCAQPGAPSTPRPKRGVRKGLLPENLDNYCHNWPRLPA